jgi:hypothetical protein
MQEHFANQLEGSFLVVRMQGTQWRIGHAASQKRPGDRGHDLHA